MADDVVITEDVQEFFHQRTLDALSNQRVEADEHTVFYIVNLLSHFTNAEELYEQTAEGRDLRPLALLFGDALEANRDADRSAILKRLGDVSLYIAGFFSPSLTRKAVGLDYFINMGGSAYGSLSDLVRGSLRGEVFGQIFWELATKFESFVDVLGEVSETAGVSNDRDILRIYELWMRTGSRRAEEKLSELGIHPTDDVKTPFKH